MRYRTSKIFKEKWSEESRCTKYIDTEALNCIGMIRGTRCFYISIEMKTPSLRELRLLVLSRKSGGFCCHLLAFLGRYAIWGVGRVVNSVIKTPYKAQTQFTKAQPQFTKAHLHNIAAQPPVATTNHSLLLAD